MNILYLDAQEFYVLISKRKMLNLGWPLESQKVGDCLKLNIKVILGWAMKLEVPQVSKFTSMFCSC